MLEIGDKIKWVNERMPHNIIYKVIDIDTTRPPTRIETPNNPYTKFFEVRDEILMEWEQDGEIVNIWGYQYEAINEQIQRGRIVIVEKHNYGDPLRNIKKLKI